MTREDLASVIGLHHSFLLFSFFQSLKDCKRPMAALYLFLCFLFWRDDGFLNMACFSSQLSWDALLLVGWLRLSQCFSLMMCHVYSVCSFFGTSRAPLKPAWDDVWRVAFMSPHSHQMIDPEFFPNNARFDLQYQQGLRVLG